MKEIPLTQGKVAIVDDEDYEWLNQYKWWCYLNHKNCYAVCRINGRLVQMHKLLMPDRQVDHKNGNGLDNRRSNLRYVTTSQNAMNKKKIINKWTSSKFKGVSRDKGKWRAQITQDGKRLELGRFYYEVEAALAYDQAAREIFGEFARMNFPEVTSITWIEG